MATTRASVSLDAQQGSPAVVRGFATFGSITFHAQDSFAAVFDRHTGKVFGGGGQVRLQSGVFIEVSASRFTQDGQRPFVTETGEVFRLGIPVDLRITPLEITGGCGSAGGAGLAVGGEVAWASIPNALGAAACQPRWAKTTSEARPSA